LQKDNTFVVNNKYGIYMNDIDMKIKSFDIVKAYNIIHGRLYNRVKENYIEKDYYRNHWYKNTEDHQKIIAIQKHNSLYLWPKGDAEPIPITHSDFLKEYIYIMSGVVLNKNFGSDNGARLKYPCTISSASGQKKYMNYNEIAPYDLFKYFNSSEELSVFGEGKESNERGSYFVIKKFAEKAGNFFKWSNNKKEADDKACNEMKVSSTIKEAFKEEAYYFKGTLESILKEHPTAFDTIKNAPEDLIETMCYNIVHNSNPDFYVETGNCFTITKFIMSSDELCPEPEVSQ
jgi:hypothetical protein